MIRPESVGYAVLPDTIVASIPSPAGPVSRQSIPISSSAQTPDDVLRDVAEHVASLRVEHLSAIGISIGGHVNPSTGVVIYAPDLGPGGMDWENIEVKKRLEELTGLPVILDNDVNCMVYHYAESDVSPGDRDNIIAVYIAPEGHGLGSGIIAGGNLLRGATGGAGEFGHVIVQPTGARCRCGSRGCLEALLSAENIAREINWGGRNNIHTLAEAAKLVTDGDAVAISAFTRAGRNFGQGLAALMNLFNPASIVVGGPEPYFGQERHHLSADMFQKGFTNAVDDYAFSNMDDCHITVAPLDPYAAASGAALLARGTKAL